ncbi:hypothetical protein ACN082_08845 [Rothia sp. CCM 9417]|uniref:hypothetical protein n=1 Tax=Rothia sp. CCM 9417 TaxID=3402657 RepID=UPI003AE6D090
MTQNTSQYRVSAGPASREGPAVVLWLGLVLIVAGLVDAFLLVPLTGGVASGLSAYLIFVALGWVFFALCLVALAWYLVSGTRLLNRPQAGGALGAGRYLAKVGIASWMSAWISLTYILPGMLAREPSRDATGDHDALQHFLLGDFLVSLGMPALLLGLIAFLSAAVCFALARIKAS